MKARGEVVFWAWDKSMWEVIQMKGRWLQICEKLMKYKIEKWELGKSKREIYCFISMIL